MADNLYTQPTLTGYNSTPPGDDGSQTATNALTWAKHTGKIGDPLKNFATDMDANILSAFAGTINIGDAQANPLSGSLAFVSDTLTISVGSVTPDRSSHLIDTEAAAGTDNLDTITTGSVGDETILYLKSVSAARVVTVRDATGNIQLTDNISVALDVNQPLVLMRNGTDWYEVSRPNVVVKDASGNVGIGEASPDDLLHVTGGNVRIEGVAPQLRLKETDGSADENWQLALSAGTLNISTANDAFSGSTPRITGLQDGSIGIGTASPEALLHISNGSAGAVSAGESADDLVIENSAAVGISLLSPSANTSRINWGSPDLNPYAEIRAFYNTGTPTIALWTDGVADLTLSAGLVSGAAIASAAEADAGTTEAIVTTTGLEETRKRLRAETSSAATSIVLTATNAGEWIQTTATGAVDLTVNTALFSARDVVTVSQMGAGQITVGGTITTRTSSSLTSRAQFSTLTMLFVSGSEMVLTGDLT